jgi:hypothetical protein
MLATLRAGCLSDQVMHSQLMLGCSRPEEYQQVQLPCYLRVPHAACAASQLQAGVTVMALAFKHCIVLDQHAMEHEGAGDVGGSFHGDA